MEVTKPAKPTTDDMDSDSENVEEIVFVEDKNSSATH